MSGLFLGAGPPFGLSCLGRQSGHTKRLCRLFGYKDAPAGATLAGYSGAAFACLVAAGIMGLVTIQNLGPAFCGATGDFRPFSV